MGASWSNYCRQEGCGKRIVQGEASQNLGYDFGTWVHEEAGRRSCHEYPPFAEPEGET